jgi:hypothetical protein
MSVNSRQLPVAKIFSAVAPLISLGPLFSRKLGENQITREVKGDGVAAMAFFHLIWNEGRLPSRRKRSITPVDRIKGNQRGILAMAAILIGFASCSNDAFPS